MIKQYYEDYLAIGLFPIPIEWLPNKSAIHPKEWENVKVPYTYESKHNGLMVRVENEIGCLDFDIKNTNRKTIFEDWKNIILNTNPDLYNKFYIEETRNKGYHIWFKYNKLSHKIGIAKGEEGQEVIALYCNKKLIYTYPTPGYSIYHQSMEDIDFITDDEYNQLILTSQLFNEYKPKYDPNKKAVTYEPKYRELFHKFDTSITDENFTRLLNDIGLFEVKDFRYGKDSKFVAFLRKGSTSLYSAKVYYKTKRLLLFTGSLPQFPSWHNKEEYDIWSLPPSFILFYQHDRDWDMVADICKLILTAQGEEIEEPMIKEGFPLEVFPDKISKSILEVCESRSLAPQFVATGGIWTISSLAGDRYFSDFNGEGKNIVFALMIAPVSVGKTPAFKVMCENVLKDVQEEYDIKYNELVKEWESKRRQAAANKQQFNDKKPTRYIPIAVDGTTEGYIAKSMQQKNGMGVYQDEAEAIFNAGGYKKNNDSISFFTQAFSGGRITQIRSDESRERVVPNLNLNLLMGTQPTRLQNVFSEDKLQSGFASRFLMVDSDYIMLNEDSDPFSKKKEMCKDWKDILVMLFKLGNRYNNDEINRTKIEITEDAKNIYRKYYKQLLTEANSRIKTKAEQYIMGTEAKMSAYFPRLCQILAIIHDMVAPVITPEIVQKGWTLYRYYAENTIRIIGNITSEINLGLPKEDQEFYDLLPNEFTNKQAKELCKLHGLPLRKFEICMKKESFAKQFDQIKRGTYAKKINNNE
jgi:hypothetical protein